MRQIRAALVLSLAMIASSSAGATCKCRAPGVVASEGQTLCIRTPEGVRLARCGKISNVASWTFLQGECPQAEAGNRMSRIAALLARPGQATALGPEP